MEVSDKEVPVLVIPEAVNTCRAFVSSDNVPPSNGTSMIIRQVK